MLSMLSKRGERVTSENSMHVQSFFLDMVDKKIITRIGFWGT